MRVSKTVREYIDKRVRDAIKKKHESEVNQAKYEESVRDEMLTLAAAAAKAAWMNTIEDAISTYPFLVKGVSFSGEQIIPTFYNSASLTYKDRTKLTSVHNVNSRIHDETKQAVENIIVELELGGTKADLERLLAEIETAE